MIPSPNEQLSLQRGSGPGNLANIPSTTDPTSPASAPDLRMAIPHASQGHSAAVDPLSTAAAFSRYVQRVLSSTRSSLPSASQGNVAVVGRVSTTATSHRIAGRFGEYAKATEAAPNRTLRWPQRPRLHPGTSEQRLEEDDHRPLRALVLLSH